MSDQSMILEGENESLKTEVQSFWNAHPCGTQFTGHPWGTKEFFDDVERFRYQTQPFMHSLIGFERYRGKDILEVGCGLGTDLLQFARAGARVTGLDLTPAGVDLVRKRFSLEGQKGTVLVGDAENLPFPEGEFDAVYSFGVLHHTPNTQKAVDEISRVLRPGGEAIVMLYHKRSLHVFLGAPVYRFLRSRSRLNATSDWVRRFDGSENPLGKAYTRNEVRTMFRGFRDHSIVLADPIRRRFPRILNQVNQRLLAPFAGFYMLIRAFKPEEPPVTGQQ